MLLLSTPTPTIYRHLNTALPTPQSRVWLQMLRLRFALAPHFPPYTCLLPTHAQILFTLFNRLKHFICLSHHHTPAHAKEQRHPAGYSFAFPSAPTHRESYPHFEKSGDFIFSLYLLLLQ
jgi:hypothetical protein